MPVVAGSTMLEVDPGVCGFGPGSVIEPVLVSVVVFTIWTVPPAESNASNVARVGERTINPGLLPA